ncbi:hypothetical protein BJ986_002258 [Phycicoccus badiiscoriae]|uniref:Fibronectin type III domain-containing protein n=1 Tax=Pedococcus badiiscoriae TaxID=642776 RepID=A0A852WJG8_9MICO|nr:hypothetical protein [Pedococcus badiiscoriae]
MIGGLTPGSTYAVLVTATNAVGTGPDGWSAADPNRPNAVYNAVNGHWYEGVIDVGISWDNAMANAAGLSLNRQAGFLGAITSRAEDDFVISSVTPQVAAAGDHLWVGAADTGPSSPTAAHTWQWRTGSERGKIFATCPASPEARNACVPNDTDGWNRTVWPCFEPDSDNKLWPHVRLLIRSINVNSCTRPGDFTAADLYEPNSPFPSVPATGGYLVEWAPPSSVTIPSTPDQVIGLRQQRLTGNSAQITWNAPPSNGAAIVHYILRVSSNDGASWTQTVTPSANPTATLTGVPDASARLVQIAGVNSAGQGPWSQGILVTGAGTRPMAMDIRTSSGAAVVGGAISWEMIPRTAYSSVTYGLTSAGTITFPAAPAGTAKVTVTTGQMPDGTLVSGSWLTTLGYDATHLQLPPPPDPGTAHRIHVALPGGLPAANASVVIHGLSATASASGFTFTVPGALAGGLTGPDGSFTAIGYGTGSLSATVTYDDGAITQLQTVDITGPDTYVTMELAPYVAPVLTATNASAGAAVNVTLSATLPAPAAAGTSSLASVPRLSGIQVTAILPPGATVGSCGARLTGYTSSTGRVTLRLCANHSGQIRFKVVGAFTGRATTLYVKGAPSLPARGVRASSPVLGRASVGWLTPEYTGGAPISRYRVVLSCAGLPTVVRDLTGHKSNTGAWVAPVPAITINGLAHSHRYSVSVYVVTAYGTSLASSTTVPVA